MWLQIGRRFGQWYSRQMLHHPFIANGAQNFTVMATGDVMAQNYELSSQNILPADEPPVKKMVSFLFFGAWHVDLRRSLVLGVFSPFFSTPFVLHLIHFCDKLFIGRTIVNACKKGFVVWIGMTFCMLPVFYTYTTVVGNLTYHQPEVPFALKDHAMSVVWKLQKEYVYNAKLSLAFWMTQWIPMFYYMPAHLRVPYSTTVNVMWNAIQSHILHRSK